MLHKKIIIAMIITTQQPIGKPSSEDDEVVVEGFDDVEDLEVVDGLDEVEELETVEGLETVDEDE